MKTYRDNATENRLRQTPVQRINKRGRPSGVERERLAQKKREQNLKVIKPGTLSWKVFHPKSQGQATESEAGPSQGTPAKDDPRYQEGLRVVAGHLQWGLDDESGTEADVEEDVDLAEEAAAAVAKGRVLGRGRLPWPRSVVLEQEMAARIAREKAEVAGLHANADPDAFIKWRGK